MSAGAFCLRCGSRRMIPAHLENSTGFCVDGHSQSAAINIGLRAGVCQHCGHVEFWVPDPSHLMEEGGPSDAEDAANADNPGP
jgi:hypothetical protein